MWLITWDPTQPMATRPLAIQKDGTWYTYGWDLTKNICEVYGPAGYIRTSYSYLPYGEVSATGDISQPIQWSSEFYDTELDVNYYIFRYYCSCSGRWLQRDFIKELGGRNLYTIGVPTYTIDILGAWGDGLGGRIGRANQKGHTDFVGNEPMGPFDYKKEDSDPETSPFNPKSTWRHFRSLDDSEKDLTEATKKCDKHAYERYAHQMQDFFAHYGQGFRADKYSYSMLEVIMSIIAVSDDYNMNNLEFRKQVEQMLQDYPTGHLSASIWGGLNPSEYPEPDNAEVYSAAYAQAAQRTNMWFGFWKQCCCEQNGHWIQKINASGKPVCENFKQPVNPFGDRAAPPVIPPRSYSRKPKDNPSSLKGFSVSL